MLGVRIHSILSDAIEVYTHTRVLLDGAEDMSCNDGEAKPRAKSAPSEYFEPYRHYAQVLRAWLVGFGVGAPVLLLSQHEITSALVVSGKAVLVLSLFLIGVSAQVLVALIYKYSMAFLYENEHSGAEINAFKLTIGNYFSTRYWPDVAGDTVAVLSYLAATVVLALAVFGQAPVT